MIGGGSVSISSMSAVSTDGLCSIASDCVEMFWQAPRRAGRAASLKPGERTLVPDVFRQLGPTLEAVRAGDEELSISKSQIGVGILGVRPRA